MDASNRFPQEPAGKTVGALVDYLFECFPEEYCEPWDKSGLLVGSAAAQVKGVAIALDPNVETIERAAEAGCNVLLTHHLAYINPPERFVNRRAGGTDPAARVVSAIKNGVALVAMHTNLDRSPLAKQVLVDQLDLDYDDGLADDGSGLPAFGCLAHVRAGQQVALEDLALRCADAYGRVPRVWGAHEDEIRTVAIANGSSNSFVSDIVKADVDCAVVGELSYHNAVEVASFGIDVIELGHDISEAPLLACLRRAVEATEAFGKRVQSLGPDIYWWQPRKVR